MNKNKEQKNKQNCDKLKSSLEEIRQKENKNEENLKNNNKKIKNILKINLFAAGKQEENEELNKIELYEKEKSTNILLEKNCKKLVEFENEEQERKGKGNEKEQIKIKAMTGEEEIVGKNVYELSCENQIRLNVRNVQIKNRRETGYTNGLQLNSMEYFEHPMTEEEENVEENLKEEKQTGIIENDLKKEKSEKYMLNVSECICYANENDKNIAINSNEAQNMNANIMNVNESVTKEEKKISLKEEDENRKPYNESSLNFISTCESDNLSSFYPTVSFLSLKVEDENDGYNDLERRRIRHMRLKRRKQTGPSSMTDSQKEILQSDEFQEYINSIKCYNDYCVNDEDN